MKSAPKPHVLFISYYFPPMGGGGVQRILKFLKYWDFNQYNVSLLTVKSSHFYAYDESLTSEISPEVKVFRTGTLDPFRLFHLLKKIFSRKNRQKKSSQRESNHSLRKLANMIFIPDSRILWLPHALFNIRKIHRRNRIHLIVATMPPYTSGLIARLSRRIMGIPYILDYRDSWFANPYLPDRGSVLQYLHRRQEVAALTSAAGVVFVNPGLEEHYQKTYEFVTEKKVETVRNGYDPEDFQHRERFHRSEELSVFRLGILGSVYSQGNAPETLLRAVSMLKQQDTPHINNLRLVFLGKWTGKFYQSLKNFDHPELLDLHEYLPHREALAFADSLDALALAIHSHLEGSRQVTPGRIYEYLYLRKPVLAMCPLDGDLANLVRECQAGEVCDYHDVAGISEILKNWLNLQSPVQKYYEFECLEQFDRRILTQKMMAFVRTVLAGEYTTPVMKND